MTVFAVPSGQCPKVGHSWPAFYFGGGLNPRSGEAYVVDGRDNVEEQGTWASHTRSRREAGCGRPEDGGVAPSGAEQGDKDGHWGVL